MKVILRQDVEKLGKSGDTVNVKDGFARNFLFPQKLVLEATAENLKKIEKDKESRKRELEQKKNEALAQAEKLAAFSCTITAEASDEDKLYGHITASEIARACAQEGLNIDKKDIIIVDPIDHLGVFQVKIGLHPEVIREIKIWIVRK